MSDEREVIPVEPESVVVSKPALAPSELIRSAQKKKAKDRTPEEAKAIRAYQKAAKKTSRRKQSNATDSDREIKSKEAEEILRADRNIRNPRVVEVCIELARVAARNLKLPFNRSLFTKGVQGTLAVMNGTEPPVVPADEWHAGERVREHELWAIWDYSTSWRTQSDGTTLSFEQWKEYRRHCITDIVWFGNFVLGKDFQPEPHGRWAEELFPKLEPALMSLPEKFGQKDIAKAFLALSDVRQRCLIAARSSFKSTFSTTFALALMLCFAGSLRILVCTATQPLAKGFAKSFRSYLTVKDPNNPSLLNQLFPEHCIAPDEGKTLEYLSPFRQLEVLIEPTLSATSVISEGQAGGRYDLAVMDDCAEISNSSTPEMRAKTQERIDMLRELGEPHSLTNYVGTPISPGAGTEEDPGDLYSVLLRREEKNQKDGGEPKLLHTICPAWAVKPGVRKSAWDPTLTEDEVDLLFPARLTFKYLMGKLRENLATDTTVKIFRQQSLVSWVPDQESELRVQFSIEELRHRTRQPEFFGMQPAQTFLSLDRAFSTSKYADLLALVCGAVQSVEGKQALIVKDVRMDRWRESDLVRNAVEMLEKQHNTGNTVSVFVAEQDKGWEELAQKIQQQLLLRNIPVPYFRWKTIQNTDRVKARRAKALELPLSDGRLWFYTASWNDAVYTQMQRFDGIKRSGGSIGSKDDFVDALGLLWADCGLRYQEEQKPEDEQERERLLEEESARYRKDFFYNRMFGEGGTRLHPQPSDQSGQMKLSEWYKTKNNPGGAPPEEPIVPTAPTDPRSKVFSYGRFVKPGSDRSKLFGVKGPYKQ